jgi:uncharacterized membrane protein
VIPAESTVTSSVRATVTAKSSYGKQLFNAFSVRQALFSMIKLELLQTLNNRYFVVLLLGAVGFMTFAAKFIGLMSVVSLLLLIVLCASVLIQAANGYYEFDLSVYFTELFVINFSRALILATLAMLIQVIIGNKYATHGVMILVYMATVLLPTVGICSDFGASQHIDVAPWPR